jgi:glucokinase
MTPAIDIGGTNTKFGLVDDTGAVQDILVLPTSGPDPARFLECVMRAISRFIPRQCKGIGVSVAGFLDEGRTRLEYNPNIAWLEGFPIRETLERQFQIPIALEVDSNAAALAEARFGVGIGSKRFLCVTVGTGIGAGMIVHGKLLRVAHGCIGDAGHVIVEPGGRECSCGGRGCAEAMASAPYVVDRYRERGGTLQTAAEIIAAPGDPAAVGALANAGAHLGIALASLANIFFPDTIAIGGGLSEAGDLLLSPASGAFRRTVGRFAGNAKLVRAALGWQAPLAGAAILFSAPAATASNRRQTETPD